MKLVFALFVGARQGRRLGPERRSLNGDDCHENGGEAPSLSHSVHFVVHITTVLLFLGSIPSVHPKQVSSRGCSSKRAHRRTVTQLW